MDTAYLKQSLGDSVTRCLAEVSEKRPRDPIEYIAQWLYKHVENQNVIAQKKAEAEELEKQRLNHEKEERLKEQRREEAKKIAEREAEKKKQEEERAKKETTSPTKLPVVIEAQEPSDEAKAIANAEQSEGQETAETKGEDKGIAEGTEGETTEKEETKTEEDTKTEEETKAEDEPKGEEEPKQEPETTEQPAEEAT